MRGILKKKHIFPRAVTDFFEFAMAQQKNHNEV